jgi:hypothetical protein
MNNKRKKKKNLNAAKQMLYLTCCHCVDDLWTSGVSWGNNTEIWWAGRRSSRVKLEGHSALFKGPEKSCIKVT